jgi:hypothetical protein
VGAGVAGEPYSVIETTNAVNLDAGLRRERRRTMIEMMFLRRPTTPLSNDFLSILRSMKIEAGSFADSTGTLRDSIFSAV